MLSRFLKAIGWPWRKRPSEHLFIRVGSPSSGEPVVYSISAEERRRRAAAIRMNYVDKEMVNLRIARDKAIKHKKRHSHYQEQLEALMAERLRLEQGK